MLQQTTVEAVRPKYDRFLARFPNLAALAGAGEDEVVAAWSGLGYYQRARNLHKAATQLVREAGGEIPDSVAELQKLPGIGRYTAGAIASIAYGRPEPILDGNVNRLLSRVFRIAGDPRSGALKARLWDLAGWLVPTDDPSSFNQGLMELGALVCRPREARCPECPLRRWCGAHADDAVERYPARPPRTEWKSVRLAAAFARDRRGRVLLVKREGERLMRGLWELPSAEVLAADSAGEAAERIRERTGLSFRLGRAAPSTRHTVMNRKIRMDAYHARLRGSVARARFETAWVACSRLAEYPHSSLLEKVLDGIG